MVFWEVWKENLQLAMLEMIRVGRYSSYVAVGTKYTYILGSTLEFAYTCMRTNMQSCKLLQLGLVFVTYYDPNNPIIFQINFAGFDPMTHYCRPSRLRALLESDIDFDLLNEHGVNGPIFWDLLMKSGLIMNYGLRWVTFDGAYDFAFMLKGLHYGSSPLPVTQSEFFYMIRLFFPHVFDVKHLVRYAIPHFRGGLQTLSLVFNVPRPVGQVHQAGSDCLLIIRIFKKLLRMPGTPFPGYVPHDTKYWGVLYGLGSIYVGYLYDPWAWVQYYYVY